MPTNPNAFGLDTLDWVPQTIQSIRSSPRGGGGPGGVQQLNVEDMQGPGDPRPPTTPGATGSTGPTPQLFDGGGGGNMSPQARNSMNRGSGGTWNPFMQFMSMFGGGGRNPWGGGWPGMGGGWPTGPGGPAPNIAPVAPGTSGPRGPAPNIAPIAPGTGGPGFAGPNPNDPFAAMGGGVQVNGGWVPWNHPAAQQALAAQAQSTPPPATRGGPQYTPQMSQGGDPQSDGFAITGGEGYEGWTVDGGSKPPDFPGGEWVWEDGVWVWKEDGSGGGGGGGGNTNGEPGDTAIPREGNSRRGTDFETWLEGFMRSLGNPQYTGFNPLQQSYLSQQAYNTSTGAIDWAREQGFNSNAANTALMQRAMGLPGFMEHFQNSAWDSASHIGGSATPFVNQGTGFLDSMFPSLMSMAQGGGAGNIQSALDAIRVQGMQGIEDQAAQLREKYGQMGMGRSSDLNESLMRGASRGIADINAAQGNLTFQNLNNAANRMLGAQQTAPAFANAAQGGGALALQAASGQAGAQNNMYNSILNMLMGQGAQFGQAAQNAQGNASSVGNVYMNAANNMMNNAQYMTGIEQFNQMMPFEIWNSGRMPTWLPQAVSFATGQNAPMVQGGSGMWQALGQIGASAMPLIAMSMMSSRSSKQDIKPVKAKSVTKALKKLPIYTWQYKGDETRHLGPMAEEFQEAFGVGDGKTINMIDMFGVLLSAAKETARAQR